MFIYYFVYIILGLILFFNKKINQRSYIIIFTIFFLLAALRYKIGNDYEMYTEIFKYNRWDYFSQTEIGFIWLNKLIKSLNLNAHYVFVIVSFLSTILFFKTIKDEVGYNKLAIFILYISGIYLRYFSLVRQSIAVGLFFLSIRYIKTRELKKYIFLILLGSLFHFSILIVAPIYFISGKKFKSLFYYSLLTITMILTKLNFFRFLIYKVMNYMPEKYNATYIAKETFSFEQNFGIGTIYILILPILMLIVREKLYEKNKYIVHYVNLIFFGIIVQIISYDFQVISRFSLYFEIFQCLAYSNLQYAFQKKERVVINSLVILINTLYFIKYLSKPLNGIVPYKSILEFL